MHHRCTGHANQIAMASNHVEGHSRHAHTFVSRSADFGASLLSFFNGAIYYHKRCVCSLLKTNGTEERRKYTFIYESCVCVSAGRYEREV